MGKGLVELWRLLRNKEVYENWPGGPVDGILFRNGIFNTEPLRKLLKKYVNTPMKRMLSITATDANKAERVVFNESLSIDEVIEACMSSSSLPAAFPHQSFKNTTFIDGGCIMGLNI